MRDLISDLRRNPLAIAGVILTFIVMIAAFFAPFISPQNPYDLLQLSIMDNMSPPMTRAGDGLLFLLGSDDQGRDLFSALLYGLRLSLMVGIIATLISLIIGLSVGITAAWFGGRVDSILMRIVDLQLSFPAILVALILLAVLGKGIDKVVIALVCVQWAYYARTIRGSALAERKKDYILAAEGLKLSQFRIMWRHLLPNALPPLIVVAVVQFAHAIALEAVLSFLGVGVPVTEPSLGLLIANGFQYVLSGQYWVSFYPGIALLLALLGLNLLGDFLRDFLNPRLEGQ